MRSTPLKIAIIPVLALSLLGCVDKKSGRVEQYAAQIGIVNHTGKYIYATKVGNQAGGHSDAYIAGVANICCISLPDRWRPGLRFLVRWDMPEETKHVWKEKVVAVEPYKEPGSLYLHFFSDDQVRIVVTNWVGGSKRHPIAPPIEPDVNN